MKNILPTEVLRCKKLAIIAPHNDDEVLGCFHLLKKLPSNTNKKVVLVTCHKNDLNLTNIRRLETLKALEGIENLDFVYWNFSDGNVKSEFTDLKIHFRELATESDLIICPAINDLTEDHIPISLAAFNEVPSNRLIWYRSTWFTFKMREADFIVTGNLKEKFCAIKKFKSQKHIKLKRALWLSVFECFLMSFRLKSAEAFLFANEARLAPLPLNSISLRHLYRLFYW